MATAGQVLDLTPLGAEFVITRTAAETAGKSFEMEWRLAPRSGGTPVHIHPKATETYEVVEGALDLLVGKRWTTLGRGESLRVDPGTPHTFRNSATTPARVRNAHFPAQRFDEYFEGLAQLVARGAIRGPKPDLKAMLHLAAHMTRFPDEIRTVKPPYFVIRAMGALGRALGYTLDTRR